MCWIGFDNRFRWHTKLFSGLLQLTIVHSMHMLRSVSKWNRFKLRNRIIHSRLIFLVDSTSRIWLKIFRARDIERKTELLIGFSILPVNVKEKRGDASSLRASFLYILPKKQSSLLLRHSIHIRCCQ